MEKKKRIREGKDEKLAREKGIIRFISVFDIINLPMGEAFNSEFKSVMKYIFTDEFTEKLDRYKGDGMTEDQCTTAKDIRRRGKNKNAAQNCRKRANERLDGLKEG